MIHLINTRNSKFLQYGIIFIGDFLINSIQYIKQNIVWLEGYHI